MSEILRIVNLRRQKEESWLRGAGREENKQPLLNGYGSSQLSVVSLSIVSLPTRVQEQIFLLPVYFQKVNNRLKLFHNAYINHSPHFMSSHGNLIMSHHPKRKSKYSAIKYFEMFTELFIVITFILILLLVVANLLVCLLYKLNFLIGLYV